MKSLISYVAQQRESDPVFYAHVGVSGVYWMSDRNRRSALLDRHHEGCNFCQTKGIAHCEVGRKLFDSMHPDDRIVVA